MIKWLRGGQDKPNLCVQWRRPVHDGLPSLFGKHHLQARPAGFRVAAAGEGVDEAVVLSSERLPCDQETGGPRGVALEKLPQFPGIERAPLSLAPPVTLEPAEQGGIGMVDHPPSPPSGPARRLPQGPPVRSKFQQPWSRFPGAKKTTFRQFAVRLDDRPG